MCADDSAREFEVLKLLNPVNFSTAMSEIRNDTVASDLSQLTDETLASAGPSCSVMDMCNDGGYVGERDSGHTCFKTEIASETPNSTSGQYSTQIWVDVTAYLMREACNSWILALMPVHGKSIRDAMRPRLPPRLTRGMNLPRPQFMSI